MKNHYPHPPQEHQGMCQYQKQEEIQMTLEMKMVTKEVTQKTEVM